MTPGFVIAILLCTGDNCDLVRPEPEMMYPSYEACSEAGAKKAAAFGEVAQHFKEAGREGEIVCLRDRTPQPAAPVIASHESPGSGSTKTAAAAESARPEQQASLRTPPPPASVGRPLQELRDCEQCPVMMSLPAGTFDMGSNADPSERPPHRVRILPFAIGKYVVTQREWNACVGTGSCGSTLRGGSTDDALPAMNISWEDAQHYIEWLSQTAGKPYRLPTEAEWEYAARAGATTAYFWGQEVGVGKANCNGCGGPFSPQLPAKVGSFAPNSWGLFDMSGLVAEWTADCWHKNYDGAPADGSVAWQSTPCRERVLRGGSWKNSPRDLTVSNRNFYDASVRYLANGLRVARSMQ
jgi:formylglycine-generating enzyme required for sulfatase activity